MKLLHVLQYNLSKQYLMSIKLSSITGDEGFLISPQLPTGVKNYLIDIDGTITDDVPNEEPERMSSVLPFPEAVTTLNRWYTQGHIITFFTSRTEEVRDITEKWLDKHGFKYNGLLMGKPRGGNYHWIDNHIVKGTRYKGVWGDLVEKQIKIEVFEDQQGYDDEPEFSDDCGDANEY